MIEFRSVIAETGEPHGEPISTHGPAAAHLAGRLGRTAGQLGLFAEVVRDGDNVRQKTVLRGGREIFAAFHD